MAPYEDRRKYVWEIRPADIIELSKRKLPAAKERQRQYTKERRRLRLEGKPVPQLETYRKDFIEEGQRKMAHKIAEDTDGTIRRPGIRTREIVQTERMGQDLKTEMEGQILQNFRNQSVRTAKLVEALFRRFQSEIQNVVKTDEIPKYVWENKRFLEDFRNMRNVSDYVELIGDMGHRFALDSAQTKKLANEMHWGRTKTTFLMDIVKELEEQLEALCRLAKVGDLEGVKELQK